MLLKSNVNEARYSPARGGSLLYVQNDSLYAQRLNVASAKLEGRDVWPILARADKKPAEPTLYWNIIRQQAVLHGDWKLIVNTKNPAMAELFDLSNDPAEARNLVAENREKVAELRKEIERERKLDPP